MLFRHHAFDSLKQRTIALPEVKAVVMRANHRAHSFDLAREPRMLQQPSHVERRVVGTNIKPHETVTWVAQRRAKEVFILGEEGDAAKPVQQRNDVRVFDSTASHVVTDLAKGNAPPFEERQLILGKVLVEKIQAAASAELFRAGRREG